MRQNLSEIIDVPGASVPFHCVLDAGRLDVPSVKRFVFSPVGEGIIKNSTGVLSLTGEIKAEMVCICDRCGIEFECGKTVPLNVSLADKPQDEENPEVFALDGDWLELGEILETCFILDMETKCLCREDCAGLCTKCGADLNLGHCNCRGNNDPRLAVLGQLLDNPEEE